MPDNDLIPDALEEQFGEQSDQLIVNTPAAIPEDMPVTDQQMADALKKAEIECSNIDKRSKVYRDAMGIKRRGGKGQKKNADPKTNNFHEQLLNFDLTERPTSVSKFHSLLIQATLHGQIEESLSKTLTSQLRDKMKFFETVVVQKKLGKLEKLQKKQGQKGDANATY